MWPEPNQEPELVVGYMRAAKTGGGNAAFHNFHNDFVHIVDANERRRLALAEIDKIPFGWYHVRAVAVAGAGFFADSYDLFAINLAIQMLGITFWQKEGGIMPSNLQTAIKASTSAGAVIGQVIFGWAADVLGRKKMYGVELIILVISTLAQALSSSSPAVSMVGLLIFGRVAMGLGLGGDYPMSAVITSEFAPTRWRGSMMAAVFSMQGFGQFTAAIVALLTTVGFRGSFEQAILIRDCTGDCLLAADRSWRIIIGFGMLPAIFALYYRITIPETPRFTFDVAQNLDKGDVDIRAFAGDEHIDADMRARHENRLQSVVTLNQPVASWADFCAYFGQWRNGSVLFATMSTWFILDFAFYGLGLNNSTILAAIGYDHGSTVYEILFRAAVGNIILVCAGAIPGYLLSVVFIDLIGRKVIQIVGFLFLTILFCIIGFGYNLLHKEALLALYILCQLFFNFGPNTTTFIVPGEVFPTRYRCTCHGLSAASGKIGATLAQVVAVPLLSIGVQPNCKGSACTPWLNHLMQVFAAFMFVGGVLSFLIPETMGRSLEELAGEEAFRSAGSTYSHSSRTGLLSRLRYAWFPRSMRARERQNSAATMGANERGYADEAMHEDGKRKSVVKTESARSGSTSLRSYGARSDEGAYRDQGVGRTHSHPQGEAPEMMPLQDVGKLLTVLK